MDRTNWKYGQRDINVLLLGVTYKNVAFPLLFRLLSKRGNSNTAGFNLENTHLTHLKECQMQSSRCCWHRTSFRGAEEAINSRTIQRTNEQQAGRQHMPMLARQLIGEHHCIGHVAALSR